MPYPPCGMGHSKDAHRNKFDRRFRSAAVLIVLIACVPVARADQTPRTGVIDDAGVIRADAIGQINGWLLELEQKTGAQMKVWTIDSTNGRDIYTLGIETARKWKLGQKKDNNGCLILIAVKDRKWRIITGEGIEDAIPDLYCDTVAQQYFVPYFRKGDYSQGILMGTAALAKAVAKDAGVELTGMPNINVRSRRGRGTAAGGVASCFSLIVMIVIFSAVFRGGRGRRRYGWGGGNFVTGMILGNVLSGLANSRRSGWGGGSSWGGGGGFGGGFGGGGGGSFGGGGAGGGW